MKEPGKVFKLSTQVVLQLEKKITLKISTCFQHLKSAEHHFIISGGPEINPIVAY